MKLVNSYAWIPLHTSSGFPNSSNAFLLQFFFFDPIISYKIMNLCLASQVCIRILVWYKSWTSEAYKLAWWVMNILKTLYDIRVEYAFHKIYHERTKFLILWWKFLHNYVIMVGCSTNKNSLQIENTNISSHNPKSSAHCL